MKPILVLGAGLVARPTVRYLLENTAFDIQLADQVVSQAEAILENHPRGTALALDVADKTALSARIEKAAIVISLLPWTLHQPVAELCLEHGSHLITASYVKPEMQAMDAAVRDKGLLFLNEMGVDPGLDHMAAMKIIDKVNSEGGHIDEFFSYCGGLPSLKDNNNPLGYKFSWSPEGAMLAANNDGRYMENGEVIEVPGSQLFQHYWLKQVPGAGVFEAYVNRDALPYAERYGLDKARSIYRGTLRNIGYCETWDYFKRLGLLNRQMKFDFDEMTPRDVIANIVNAGNTDIKTATAAYLNIPAYSLTLKKLEWLGLFSDKKLRLGTASVFDMFAHTLKNRLVYEEGEQDLLIQHHEFEAIWPDRPRMTLKSTLVDTGKPGGDSSMSRTVGLPVGIGARLLAEGKITQTGVRIPVTAEIYAPVLSELENFDIKFIERASEQADEPTHWGD